MFQEHVVEMEISCFAALSAVLDAWMFFALSGERVGWEIPAPVFVSKHPPENVVSYRTQCPAKQPDALARVHCAEYAVLYTSGVHCVVQTCTEQAAVFLEMSCRSVSQTGVTTRRWSCEWMSVVTVRGFSPSFSHARNRMRLRALEQAFCTHHVSSQAKASPMVACESRSSIML